MASSGGSSVFCLIILSAGSRVLRWPSAQTAHHQTVNLGKQLASAWRPLSAARNTHLINMSPLLQMQDVDSARTTGQYNLVLKSFKSNIYHRWGIVQICALSLQLWSHWVAVAERTGTAAHAAGFAYRKVWEWVFITLTSECRSYGLFSHLCFPLHIYARPLYFKFWGLIFSFNYNKANCAVRVPAARQTRQFCSQLMLSNFCISSKSLLTCLSV